MDNQIITVYPTLDKILGGGLHPGEVTVLAGRLCLDIVLLNIILNNIFRNRFVTKNDVAIAYYSVYDAEDTANRLICIEAGYEMHSGTPSISVQNKISNIIKQLKETELYIKNIISVPVDEIIKMTKYFQKPSRVDFIVIDSFQSFVRRKPPYHPFGNPDDAIHAANGIKQLAKDLEIPILISYYPVSVQEVCKPMLDVADNIIRLHRSEDTNIITAEVTKSIAGVLGSVDLIYEKWWKRITEQSSTVV